MNRDVSSVVSGLSGDVDVTEMARVPGEAVDYPLWLVRAPATPRMGRPNVLVSGGVHGDEPAGVLAALDFLRGRRGDFAEAFNLFVLPCVNPGGYERATLESCLGHNLNRLFGTDGGAPENRAIENWLKELGFRFRFTIDLHETPPDYEGEGFTAADNPCSCYLYETVTDASRRIGGELIRALPAEVPVCDWPKIYLDLNDGGVVSYPEANQNPIYSEGTTFEGYVNGRYTAHSMTTETPTGWHLERRVDIQRLWLERALELVADD